MCTSLKRRLLWLRTDAVVVMKLLLPPLLLYFATDVAVLFYCLTMLFIAVLLPLLFWCYT